MNNSTPSKEDINNGTKEQAGDPEGALTPLANLKMLIRVASETNPDGLLPPKRELFRENSQDSVEDHDYYSSPSSGLTHLGKFENCPLNCSKIVPENVPKIAPEVFPEISPIKGQIISKGFLMLSISSKKRTKEFDFTTMIPQVDLFSFVFGGNRRHQKNILKLSDL